MVIGLLMIWKHACIDKALEDVLSFPFLFSLLGNDVGDEIEKKNSVKSREPLVNIILRCENEKRVM